MGRRPSGRTVMTILRSVVVACSAVVVLALFGHSTWSQSTGTIKVVVPYSAGGVAATLVRLLAEQIGRTQGPTVIIENRPGAGAVIGTEAVARAAPDGNTVL